MGVSYLILCIYYREAIDVMDIDIILELYYSSSYFPFLFPIIFLIYFVFIYVNCVTLNFKNTSFHIKFSYHL